MKVLEGINLVKSYGEGETKVVAVNNINVSIERGEFVTIVGTSGSGKSTLLHLLGGLDYATSGKIIIDGRDIQTLKKDELSIFRRRNIGFIFQGFNLVPVLTVYENVVLPINADGKNPDEKFVKEIMESLGIWIKKDKYPNQLSGGQQQRVAIARALVTRPSIVLADEPTGNLDSKNTEEVMSLLKSCSKKYNQTIVLITHNDEIAHQGDRSLRIEDGKIFE
ncbi:MAG: ABC transporter ATP-binding protein [Clostridium sp.]|uniref:ABC transporter ATP-binding protein n=1 Tax=Clostridium sp. TaxID=1506 RepID=UPI003EE5844A